VLTASLQHLKDKQHIFWIKQLTLKSIYLQQRKNPANSIPHRGTNPIRRSPSIIKMAPSLPLRSTLRSLKRRIEDSSTLRKVTAYLPPLNFITVHYAYFISVCLVTSLIFYGMSTPKYAIGYTDSLFLVVSAMTEAGLNTVNLSQMTTGQQFLLWLLIMIVSDLVICTSGGIQTRLLMV
jgi:hypothetical protein